MQLSVSTPLHAPDGRTAEILGLVRKAFVEKGFDGASMQDLARSAGMSVGNFYRYFPSKDAIIEALVALDLDQIDRDFAKIIGSPDPMLALRRTMAEHLLQGGCDGEGVLIAETMAAALRKPRIAEVMARMDAAICEKLVAVFRLTAQAQISDQGDRFMTEAQMLVFLFKASAMYPDDGTAAAQSLKARVRRTIDDILNSISKD